MRSFGALAVVLAAACLDAPPGAVVPSGDGGRREADAAPGTCVWSEPQMVASVTGMRGLTLDETELTMVVEAGGILRMFSRTSREEVFTSVSSTWLELVNSAEVEANPALSADGLSLYFTRGDSTAQYDAYLAERIAPDAAFDSVAGVDGLSLSEVGENGLAVWDGEDRREIFYAYDTGGYEELARAVCPAPDTCAPGGLLDGVSTGDSQGYPSLSGDGLDLYFERQGAGIFRAHRGSIDAEFEIDPVQPVYDTEAATHHDPEISEDGNTLYFLTKPQPSGGFIFEWSARLCQ